jgi:hypothetical protein
MNSAPPDCRTPRGQCQWQRPNRVARTQGGCHAPGDHRSHRRATGPGTSRPCRCGTARPSASPLRAGQPHVAVPRLPAWRARAGAGASGPAAAWPEGSLNPAPAAVPSAGAAFAFTIAGARPVPPNGSQDGHAQGRRQRATALGSQPTRFWVTKWPMGSLRPVSPHRLISWPTSSKGGTEVDYLAGSPISQRAMSSTPSKR